MWASTAEAREADLERPLITVGWGRRRLRTKAQIRMLQSLDRGGIHVGEAGSRSLDSWAPASQSKDRGFKDWKWKLFDFPWAKGPG